MNITIHFYGADQLLTQYMIEFIRTNCHRAKITTNRWLAPADMYDIDLVLPEEYSPSLAFNINRELIIFDDKGDMKIIKFSGSHYMTITID